MAAVRRPGMPERPGTERPAPKRTAGPAKPSLPGASPKASPRVTPPTAFPVPTPTVAPASPTAPRSLTPNAPTDPSAVSATPALRTQLPASVTLSQGDAFTAKTRQRFDERRKSIRRAGRHRWYRFALTLGVVAVLAYVIFFSPVFAVRQGEVEISGLTPLVPSTSVDGIVRSVVGTPLIRVNTGGITAKLEKLVGVRSATVTRRWPTGLSIVIDARTPAAVVKQGNTFVTLDSEGVQIGSSPTQPKGLPLIAVPLTSGNTRTIESVLAVLGSLPSWLSTQLASVSATTQDTVSFTLTSGASVVWGDSSQAQMKADVLKILLAKQKASVYDVSAPTMPVTK